MSNLSWAAKDIQVIRERGQLCQLSDVQPAADTP